MLNIATYSRVSTKLEAQRTSIENQADFFIREIEKHKDKWVLYKNYVDYGKTGTSKKKRYEFNQMVEDAQTKKFDILIAKSMTRFGRNRADTSHVLLKILFPLGIRVIFVEEKLDSENKDDRAKMGLFEWLAEIESRKISDRMYWQIDQLLDKKLVVGSRSPYGYNIESHKLFINPEEAIIVKIIYELYLKGWGIYRIVDYLNENNYKPRTANKWAKTSIKIILTNGNYTGSLYQKKSKTLDPISKEKIRYNQSEWLKFENTHEPIIDEETFNRVQQEKLLRIDLQKNNIKYSGINRFSNIIKCGRCNGQYIRKKVHNKYVYSCAEYEKKGTKSNCKREAIDEEDIFDILNDYVKNMLNNNLLDKVYESHISKITFDNKDPKQRIKTIENEISKLNEKCKKLLDSYFGENKLNLSDEQYTSYNNDIQNDIKKLTTEKLAIVNKLQIRNDLDSMYKNFKNKLSQLDDIKNWDNQTIREFFPQIIIYDKDNIKILNNIQAYDTNHMFQDSAITQLYITYCGTI
jgi:DNA invertase Pin-like site-specific DNA recombinase